MVCWSFSGEGWGAEVSPEHTSAARCSSLTSTSVTICKAIAFGHQENLLQAPTWQASYQAVIAFVLFKS